MATPKKTTIKKRPPKPKPTKPKKTGDLEIVMVPVEDLIPDEDNPNEMDERTFDALIEEIREQGFDEPIHARPHPDMEGKYQIGSGHHRYKAACVIGLGEIPTVIKHWDDRQQKAALAKRNALRGQLNKEKMVALYQQLAKGRDPASVQRELGFTDTKSFEKLVDTAIKSLPKKQSKKLAEAKENIKSIDDLSSVLNRIFKEAGSELDKGYMVFSWGGKKHHYFQIDDATNAKLEAIIAHCEETGQKYTDFMQSIVAAVELPAKPKRATKKRKSKGPVKNEQADQAPEA